MALSACSGEEIPEGTIARQAVRRVLEGLRPQQTVTLCLPLFLAGEVGERRFASEHPTITVDGCDKLCAKRGTEQFSGAVSASLVVTDILGGPARGCHRSTRDADKADEQAVWLVAERIAAEVDALTASEASERDEPKLHPRAAQCCACGRPSPDGKLEVNGKSVIVNGLPLIFEHLRKNGLQPDNAAVRTRCWIPCEFTIPLRLRRKRAIGTRWRQPIGLFVKGAHYERRLSRRRPNHTGLSRRVAQGRSSSPAKIVVSDVNPQVLDRLKHTFGSIDAAGADNAAALRQDVVFIALHPPTIGGTLSQCKSAIKPEAIVVSLAPKLKMAKLSGLLDGFGRLARVIPNAPSIVGMGFNPIAFSSDMSPDDRTVIRQLLSPLGDCRETAEEKLEAYAVLSAMGPTYFWPMLYELVALGESFGLDRTESVEALKQMLAGTVATMQVSGLDAATVQDLVPVKPLADLEPTILEAYRVKLKAVYEKIKP